MEPKELRIGSVLTVGNYEVKVIEIQSQGVQVCDLEETQDTWEVFSDRIKPVIINEEWLNRAGFEKNPDPQMHGLVFEKRFPDMKISLNHVTPVKSFITYVSGPFGMVILKKIKFVHQLQNIYFVLTGTELEFNP